VVYKTATVTQLNSNLIQFNNIIKEHRFNMAITHAIYNLNRFIIILTEKKHNNSNINLLKYILPTLIYNYELE